MSGITPCDRMADCWWPGGHKGECQTETEWERCEVERVAQQHETIAAQVRGLFSRQGD